ncbi:hypothetical protein MN608_01550 [Microdochium nivale]|nr:hypothetical protein MN608_01550 [Microdochium nivale]
MRNGVARHRISIPAAASTHTPAALCFHVTRRLSGRGTEGLPLTPRPFASLSIRTYLSSLLLVVPSCNTILTILILICLSQSATLRQALSLSLNLQLLDSPTPKTNNPSSCLTSSNTLLKATSRARRNKATRRDPRCSRCSTSRALPRRRRRRRRATAASTHVSPPSAAAGCVVKPANAASTVSSVSTTAARASKDGDEGNTQESDVLSGQRNN